MFIMEQLNQMPRTGSTVPGFTTVTTTGTTTCLEYNKGIEKDSFKSHNTKLIRLSNYIARTTLQYFRSLFLLLLSVVFFAGVCAAPVPDDKKQTDPTIIYTITFNSNEGSIVVSIAVQSGKAAIKPTDPKKEGYIFAGWFKDAGLKNAFDFDTEKITENIILHAKWSSSKSVLSKLILSLSETLPFGTDISGAAIKEISIENGATSSVKTNEILTFNANKAKIKITAEDNTFTEYDVILNATIGQPTFTTYSGGLFFGQAIKDRTIWQKPDNTTNNDAVLLTVSNIANTSVTWKLESTINNNLKTQIGTKTAANNKIEITSADLPNQAGDLLNEIANDNTITATVTIGSTTSTQTITYKPKELRSWHDVQAMRVDLAGDYVLMNNIAFPEPGTNDLSVYGLEPIGKDSIVRAAFALDFDGVPFSGSFDGKGFTISNVLIKGPTNVIDLGPVRPSFSAFFGKIDAPGKTFQNVIIDHSGIESYAIGSGFAAEVVAGTIKNVGVISTKKEVIFIIGTNKSISGGLVGLLNGGEIIHCYTKTNIKTSAGSLTQGVGGLVGNTNSNVTVSGYATGDVTVNAGSLSNCGGLVGANRGNLYGYATGNVTGVGNSGGLVGNALGGNIVGYATGNVFVDDKYVENIGGLIGSVNTNSTYPNANVTGYATGKVGPIETEPYLVISNVGGLVGKIEGSNVQITGYYTGSQVAGSNQIGGLIGVDDSQANIAGYVTKFRLIRTTSEAKTFGFLIGNKLSSGPKCYYFSNNDITGNYPSTDRRGYDGTLIDPTHRSNYDGYAFVDDATPGPWVWRDGKKPALRLRYSDGTDIISTNDQP
ncbi:hypothetical protein CHS0354_023922 [Potamilus streckersoni]|uniref:Uncharacterized protein n=1 Tax=Potamilus streckersoni TaxID=2493646 RepID=A0AAE0RZF3_9BIVA|nr:hypothetical protein CHS0354_023922 [Potamilus streckersoni]